MSPLDPTVRPVVLVVDDTPENLQLMHGLLREAYQVKLANHGVRALELASREPLPDLILLDIMMPEIDGFEVCRRLKGDPRTADIPIIFLTAITDVEAEAKGFAAGAVDFILKPISPPVVLARVDTHVRLRAATVRLRSENTRLEGAVQDRTQLIVKVQDALMIALATLAETRDTDTGLHVRRTQLYVRTLAERLRTHPVLGAELTAERVDLLTKAAALHDIGKVGIPDAVLLKPGRLDEVEVALMRTHTTIGRDALKMAEAAVEGTTPFLQLAREIAHLHQEKWDGTGYPEGLSGTSIPLGARLMAVADVYDALTMRRPYKEPWPHERAVEEMQRGRGSHFDPDILDAFLETAEEFRRIAADHAD